VLAVLQGTLASLACGRDDPAPSEAAGRQTAPGHGVSEEGRYRVGLRPRDGGVPMGRLHAWVVTTETADGVRFAPIRLAFGGGMPQHAHGFDTEPRVTRALAEGEYLVEGVRFHMSGEWTLRVELVGPAGPDVAIFRLQVAP
jgi:hypothetical protein